MNETTAEKRTALIENLFPEGIPRLWCALLTHYDKNGRIDKDRIAAHLDHIRPHVPAVLAPGSTGDGWEMTPPEVHELTEFLLQQGAEKAIWVMLGVLRTGMGEAHQGVLHALDRYTGGCSTLEALAAAGICGVTVTPPKGADLSPQEIYDQLEAVLSLGVPTALYQLPQITENEMTPETVEALAHKHPNFYMMKDTSGNDRVATSPSDTANVYMVRGAEGDYHSWLKEGGGCYDGFLLSSANCFAPELARIIESCEEGDVEEAREVSRRVTTVFRAVFAAAENLPFGNPFTNTNKAIDHIFAYGPRALTTEPPLTHSGSRIPVTILETAAQHLEANGFSVNSGYLV